MVVVRSRSSKGYSSQILHIPVEYVYKMNEMSPKSVKNQYLPYFEMIPEMIMLLYLNKLFQGHLNVAGYCKYNGISKLLSKSK